MYYARWATNKEFSKILTPINPKKEVKKSGIPLMYNEPEIYIDETDNHSLILGDTGSGKTQAITLPLIRLSMQAEESFVVNDINGEIIEETAKDLEDNGYKIIVIDYKNPKLGNNWNPFTLSYKLYKEDNKAESIKILEKIGYYLFFEQSNIDPFWINSTIDYFTGLCLYLYENAREEEINLSSVFALSNYINEDKNINKFLKQIDKNSNIYYNLSGTLNSPKETRGGIIATFTEKIKKYLTNEELNNMTSSSDFDITSINDKTAIFIISGINDYTNSLIPLFIDELINSRDNYNENKKRLNIILEEFDELNPIKNFPKLLNYSRSLNIKFTLFIKRYKSLENIYGKEVGELIESSVGNTIYLWSNDIDTLEKISKLCGNTEVKNKIVPLVSVEELKTMKVFETIILKQRMMPFKTKLIPDWKIKWVKSSEKYTIPQRKEVKIKIYKYNIQ